MTDLLTVTLNPALDLGTAIDFVSAGPKLRLDEPTAEPGGGGVNVARAAAAMGGAPRAIVALGGLTGGRMKALLEQAPVGLVTFEVEGETRQNLAVTDRQIGRQYRLQMPGPTWTEETAERMLLLVEDEARAIGQGAVVVLSGSQPPGLAADFPERLARRLNTAVPGVRLVIDTSGPALERLVSQPAPGAAPQILRMDQAESEGLAGHALASVRASLDFAQSLVRRGVAECLIMARGAEGSVLATAELRLHCKPPAVEEVSKIGAGDSFTAGFALSLAHGGYWSEALQRGTAAAAAAVMTPGTELCRGSDVVALLPGCQLTADL